MSAAVPIDPSILAATRAAGAPAYPSPGAPVRAVAVAAPGRHLVIRSAASGTLMCGRCDRVMTAPHVIVGRCHPAAAPIRQRRRRR